MMNETADGRAKVTAGGGRGVLRSMVRRFAAALPPRRVVVRIAAVLTLVSSSFSGPATAVAAGPVIPEPQTRLLVGGPASDGEGTYSLGLDIVLPDGWHTYWRHPGDTGLPPTIEAVESGNLESLAVAFPAPQRYDDGFSTSIVYHGRVVLPLDVAADDPGTPVHLVLDVLYGYCKDVCVPASARFEVDLRPDMAADPAAAGEIAAARALVPVPEAASDGALRVTAFEPAGEEDGRPVRRVVVEAPAGAAVDLFAEGPQGWSLPLPRPVAGDPTSSRHVFLLTIDGLPRHADPAGATIRLTAVAGGRAIEAERRLD